MNNTDRISMSPIDIGGVTLKNRYAAGAVTARFLLYGQMGEYLPNGEEFEVSHARGGFGLIVTGSNYGDQTVDGFDPLNAKPSPLYAPKTSSHSFRMVTDRVHKYGSKIFMQIAFGPGRMRNGKSCSVLPTLADPEKFTKELTVKEIELLISEAVRLAVYAKSNGFDGIEIHAHFGYLLDQFEMTCTNHRTDKYGGDLDGRLTVYRELITGIKTACGSEFPVALRMGLKTYMKSFTEATLDGSNEFGRDVDETLEAAKKLESYGIDMFDFNVGTYESHYYCVAPYYVEKGYVVDMAARVKKAVGVPVFCVGLMDDIEMCEKALADGKIDGITICRAAMVDTQYARKVYEGRIKEIRPCIQCGLCEYNNLKSGMVYCSSNPAAMREFSYGVPTADTKKKVAVIGGGIAGLVAAHTAARAGHTVTIYERADSLGGKMNFIGAQRFKTGVKKLNEWYQHELVRLGVEIKTNSEMDAASVRALGTQVVIIAQGSHSKVPEIKGIQNEKTVFASAVMAGTARVGQRVAVVGGGCSGAETAYDLRRFGGREVILVEQEAQILDDRNLSEDVRNMLKQLLDYYGVEVVTNAAAKAINEQGVIIAADGHESLIEADTVVIAAGTVPEKTLTSELAGSGLEIFEVGDAVGGRGTIQTASLQAYEIAMNL